MTTELTQKLEPFLKKTFVFEGKCYFLKKVRENVGKIILETDKRTFVLFPKELDSMLNEIKAVRPMQRYKASEQQPSSTEDVGETYGFQLPEETPEPEPETATKFNLQVYEPTDTEKKINDSLMLALDNVLLDEKNIPQAQAVCSIANTLINLKKNQINLMNALKRVNKKQP